MSMVQTYGGQMIKYSAPNWSLCSFYDTNNYHASSINARPTDVNGQNIAHPPLHAHHVQIRHQDDISKEFFVRTGELGCTDTTSDLEPIACTCQGE